MLFSEEWLRHYINPDLDSKQLCEKLTMGGLEVEGMDSIAPDFHGVVVAQVLTVDQHPNADKLHVCTVDTGKGEPIQIVCGAPNVAPGVKVPCALDGAVLPGNFKIKKSKLRGEVSNGMLCSSRELGIDEDHRGLWILPADAPVGEDIRKYAHLDGKKIEIKLTPNRGDALSILGIARDLRAMTGAEMTTPDFSPVEPTCHCTKKVKVEAPELCGRFSGRIIAGLNAKAPTPQWMKDRLERSGQRSISALVDISNYVMLELGRPTHFFDLDKINGPLVVRWGKEGEKAELLNGKTVDIDPYFGVIADDNGVEAIAGIMGGEGTSISLDTKNIFVEAAFWWPTSIQGRCRKLNFSTDAAYRFERGVDFASNPEHLEYITKLVVEICGTPETKIGPVVDQVIALPETKQVKMRADRCRKVIGIDITDDQMEQCLKNLNFPYVKEDSFFTVTAPSYRFDIEIEEDLIEEVARLIGYEALPEVPPLARIQMKEQPEDTRTRHQLRCKLAGLGFQELINYSFVEDKADTLFTEKEDVIKVLNPIASQMNVMRTQMISGLIDNLVFNLNRKAERVNIFEYGRVFWKNDEIKGSDSSVQGVEQPVHFAALSYGAAAPAQWGQEKRLVDFYDLKGVLEAFAFPLKLRFEPYKHPALHPGRTAKVMLNGEQIGFIGEIHPKILQQYNLPHAPVVFEVDATALMQTDVPSYKGIPKQQPILRDLAVWVDDKVPVQELLDAVKKASKTDPRLLSLASFDLFDVYKPKKEDTEMQGKKSLAFAIKLQANQEALEENEIEEAVAALVETLEAKGASLRK